MLSLKKIDINNIVGDKDNPRELNTTQFDLLKLSLRKFGLLSPLFITDTGMLLSGHQRTKTLRTLGQPYIYVCVIPANTFSKSVMNSVNFIFNKELQEISNVEVKDEKELAQKHKQIKQYLEQLPDKENLMEGLENIELIEPDKLNIIKRPTMQTIKTSTALFKRIKQTIPLIIDADNNIVNGSARYEVYKKKFKQIPCIRVKNVTADIFHYITANYTLKGKEDNIRVEQRRHFIDWRESRAYLKLIGGNKIIKMPLTLRNKYIYDNFPSILDFGSGNGKQSAIQRYVNKVEHILFEPFACGAGGSFSYNETYTSIENLLNRLEDPRPFNIVKANTVLNSVPFEEDSKKVELLLKFLSAGSTFLIVSSRNKVTFERELKVSSVTKINDTGKNTFLSSGSKVKVQRFHTAEELAELFYEKGIEIKTVPVASQVFIRVDKPIYHISKEKLIEAVEFEFGINYYGRVFEDLKQRAVEVFSKRYDYYVEIGLVKELKE